MKKREAPTLMGNSSNMSSNKRKKIIFEDFHKQSKKNPLFAIEPPPRFSNKTKNGMRISFLALYVEDDGTPRPTTELEADMYIQALHDLNETMSITNCHRNYLRLCDADFTDSSKKKFSIACADRFTYNYLLTDGSFSHYRICDSSMYKSYTGFE